ncbi:hypothetical protein OAS18_04550 [Nitrospinaceae bacterium]|nr:hypothetical protein [Nitrospinaceae bacterium]
MDIQAVNSAGNPTPPKPKPTAYSPLPLADPSSAPNGDTVNLSQEAQSLAQQDKASSSKITTDVIKERKLSVTDNNDVVLEVIDPQTQKVIRTVPSEEQLELRNAIRDELDKI